MHYASLLVALSWAHCLHAVQGQGTERAGIHLNIEYPKEDKNGSLNVNTGDNDDSSEVKTPVVIIAPKSLLDYERLYKKIMSKPPQQNKRDNIERDALYNERVAYSDPASRRKLLFELLKEAEADLAFYRADYSEMELLLSAHRK